MSSPTQTTVDNPTFAARPSQELPRLAWVARCSLQSPQLAILHGASVEVREHWLVEGVWDQAFASGDFHNSAHFFGSGVRCDGDAVYFCPSTALTDRLLYCTIDDVLHVSNSLGLLLANTGARLDPEHNYRGDIKAVLKGIHDYDDRLYVTHPQVEAIHQLYHHNLVLRDGKVSKQPKPRTSVSLQKFEDYERYLLTTMQALADNAVASDRTLPLEQVSSLSSGYDSTAVATLAHQVGVRRSYSVSKSSGLLDTLLPGRHSDNGHAAQAALGLQSPRYQPIPLGNDELFFHAAACEPAETAFYPLFAEQKSQPQPAVLYSGYHGDKAWDRATKGRFLEQNICRGDMSGLPLAEARLAAGVINVAVPFLAADRVAELVQINNSEAMQPWRLGNDYDRPIPRRIAEQAGVPRASFGMHKSAITRYRHLPENAALRGEYFAYCRERGQSPLGLRVRIVRDYAAYYVNRLLRRPAAKGSTVAQNQLFVWAANRVAERYRQLLR